MKKGMVVAAAVGFIVTVPAFAMTNQSAKMLAIKAYDGNVQALSELVTDATAGDRQAEAWLGSYYQYKDSYGKANIWLHKGATQGSALAQYGLGYAYQHDEGVPENYAMAFHWYQKSANSGYSMAQNNLGQLFFNGQGVQKSYPMAKHWFLKSVAQGNAFAECNLGLLYFKPGIDNNFTKGIYWFRKSAKHGNAKAEYFLGISYAAGLGVPKDQNKAGYWLLKSAHKGYQPARALLNHN